MSTRVRASLLWVVLIASFFAIWWFLDANDPQHRPINVWAFAGVAATIGGFSLLIFAVRRWNASNQKHTAALALAAARLKDGHLDEADGALAEALASKRGQFRRAALVQAAEIACARWDRPRAIALLDEAIALPPAGISGAADRLTACEAFASRALLHASAGDEQPALADVAAVKSSHRLTPNARVDSVLAEALLLERKDDRAGVRTCIEGHGPLLWRAQRETRRALARALDAWAADSGSSVYRRAATADGSHVAAPARYVEFVCPRIAAFARLSRSREPDAPFIAAATPAARAAVEAIRTAPKTFRDRYRTIAAGLAIAGACFLWVALEDVRLPWITGWAVAAIAVLALVVWIAGIFIGAFRNAARRAAIQRAYQAGDLDLARLEVRGAARSGEAYVHAQSWATAIAVAEGDLEGALLAATNGLQALARLHGGWLPQPAPPAPGQRPPWDYGRILAGHRALVLAGLGRIDEARAELLWSNGLPNAFTSHLVEALGALRFGDLARVTAFSESYARGLEPDNELLFEMARYVAGPGADVDVAWIRRSLLRYPRLRVRSEAFAPGLIARFESEVAGRETS